jgi:hypothetical protein
MSTMTWTYVAYLVICVGITIWVAQMLRKHGRVVLADGHDGRKELSEAFSQLLVVGFYLVNLGVVSFYLKINGMAGDAQTAIELVSTKIGTVLLVLGAMHFLIVLVLAKVRHMNDTERAEQEHRAAILEHRRLATEPIFERRNSDDR